MRWLLVLWLLLPGLAMAETAEEVRDRTYLAGLIEDNLSSVSRVVRIDGFAGALSSRATVQRLSIADAGGEWLVAEGLTLDWSRAELLRGRLDVDALTAERITLIRPPVAEADAPSPQAVPFALPELPVSVSIGALTATEVVLGAAVLGQEVRLSVDGTLLLAGGAGTARLRADRLDGAVGQFVFSGGFSNSTGILTVNLELAEEAGGIAAQLLGLPGDPALALQLVGSAPIDSFGARVRLATDGQDRVTGRLDLTGGDGARQVRLDLRGDVSPLFVPELRDFFGTEARLVAEGAQRPDGGVDLTTLDIAARALILTGSAQVAPDGWPLALRLAGVIGAPDGGPVTLPVAGGQTRVTSALIEVAYDQAQGDGWTGKFEALGFDRPGMRVPQLSVAAGGWVRPAAEGQDGAFSADLTYAARGIALDDAALAEAIGTEVSGGVTLSRDGGPLLIRGLTVEGPDLTAAGEGRIGGPSDGFRTEGSLTLTADRLERFAALSGLELGGQAALLVVFSLDPEQAATSVILTGQTDGLRLGIGAADPYLAGAGTLSAVLERDTAGTRIESLDIATGALTVEGRAVLTEGGGTADVTARLVDVSAALPGLAGPAAFTGEVAVDAAGAAQVTGALTLPGAALDLTAQIAPDGVAQVNAVAQAPDLASFSALTGLDLRGRAEVAVAGTLAGVAAFDLTVEGQAQGLALGVPALDAALGGRVDLSGKLTAAEGVVRLTSARLTALALQAEADAQWDAAGLTADLGLTADAAALLPGLAGPLNVAGRVARDPGGVLALDLTGTAAGARAHVTGHMPTGGVFDGQIALASTDLSEPGAVLGLALGGGAELTATGQVAPDLSAMDLVLNGTMQDLRSGVAGLDPVLAGAGTVSARLTGAVPGGLTLSGLNLATPALSLTGSASLTAGAVAATFDLSLPQAAVLLPGLTGAARAQGTLTRAADGAGRIDLSATVPGGGATLAADLAGGAATGRLTLDLPDLAPWARLAGRPLAGGISAQIDGTLAVDMSRFDLTVNGRARNLNPGNATLAMLLRGQGTVQGRLSRGAAGGLLAQGVAITFPNLSLSGNLDGLNGRGTAQFRARLADIALFAPEFSGPVTAEGTARRGAGGVWTVATTATGPGGTAATIGGTVSESGRLGLRLAGRAPLGLLNGQIEPRRLSGEAALDLRLDGAAAVSSLSGTVGIADARLSDPVAGVALSGINGALRLAGGRAAVELSATAQAGGQLEIGGTVGLAAPFAADLSVSLDALALRDPALYETTASGTVTIVGPLVGGGGRIGGTIALGRTELQVPSSGVGSFGDLPDVVHVNPSTDVRQTLARAGLTGTAGGAGVQTRGFWALDLTINAPDRVFIRGRGLDAELGGTLRLGGTTANVVPAGEFGLIRGRLEILQQRFTLTEGSATLQGGFVPVLRLVARTTARTGTEIDIIVEGPADAPQVTFVSRPELPQDEVLAQLLFGRNLSTLTPLQAVQLASAVGTLAGRGGGGLIAGLRAGIGVDDFDVTADDQGNAALRLGAYLTEDLYTDVTVGTGGTEINLNLDLTDDITARGSVSSEGETSLGVFFERDY